MKWAEAVKAWNAKHNAGGKYRIPSKGTDAYNEVMKMMGKEPAPASVPKAPAAEPAFKRETESSARQKKLETVAGFLKDLMEKRRAKKEATAAGPKEAEGSHAEKAKLGKHNMLAQLEETLKSTVEAAAAAPPIRRKKLLEEAVKMRREISKLKKELKSA